MILEIVTQTYIFVKYVHFFAFFQNTPLCFLSNKKLDTPDKSQLKTQNGPLEPRKLNINQVLAWIITGKGAKQNPLQYHTKGLFGGDHEN